MRIDLPNLVGATIVTGSLAITGSVTPGSDALYDFGSTLRRWNNIYAANISGSLTGSNVTVGQIVVAGTGGVLSGTNNLFWNNSNGRLGIGMTNPSFKLDLSDGQVGVGVGAWSAPAAAKGTFVDGDKFVLFSDVNNKRVIGTNNTGYGVYFQNNTIDNDGFTFIEGNSALTHFTRIKLGKVGIGSTNPTDQVTISSGNVQVPRNSYLGSSATGAAITIGTSGGSQIAFPQVGSNDEVSFITHVNGSFHGERVRIAASGNVGLGTTNPGFRLQLGNNTAASTATPETISLGGSYSNSAGANTKLRLYYDSSVTYGIGVSGGQLDYTITDAIGSHVFYTNNSVKMKISGSSAGGGNAVVGIGVTNPYAPLHIKSLTSNAYGESIVIDPGAATPTYSTISFRAEGAQGSNFTGTWIMGKQMSSATGGEAFFLAKQGLTGGSSLGNDFSQAWLTNGNSSFGFNVGIGTTNPGYKLTIAGGPPGGQAVFAVDNTAYFVAKNAAGTYEDYFWPRWSDNIMYLNYGSAGWNIRNSSSTSTMFMTNGGNVGIGTTNPQHRLQIGSQTSTSTATPDVLSLGGTFSSTPGSNIKLRVWTDGSTMFGLGVSTGQLDYSVTTGASHVWYIAGTEYLRLNSTVLAVSSSLQPGTDNARSLGSSSKRWSTVHATALSGSLTKLSTGEDYLVAGPNIQLTTGSNGQVTITGTSSGTVAGSGTAGLVTRWTGTSSIGTGVIYDDGTNVGVGTTPGGDKLAVNGSMSVTGSLLPGADVSYSLGSEQNRWQNIYTGDLHLKNERGDWTLIEEDDCLTMRNNKTGKRYKILMERMPELDEPLGGFSTGPKPSP